MRRERCGDDRPRRVRHARGPRPARVRDRDLCLPDAARRRHPRGRPGARRDAVDRHLGGARARDRGPARTPRGPGHRDLGGARQRGRRPGGGPPGLGRAARVPAPQPRGADPAPAGHRLRGVRVGGRDPAPRPRPARGVHQRVQGAQVRARRDPDARRRRGPAAAHRDDEARDRDDAPRERRGLPPGGPRRRGRGQGRRAPGVAPVEPLPQTASGSTSERPTRRSRRPGTGRSTS